jgi:catechol-2,3-dioxygenase
VADAADGVHIALFAPVARARPADRGGGDHAMSLSLYFSDPDGNPYEITTYDVTSAPR